MAITASPIFARNTLPSISVSNAPTINNLVKPSGENLVATPTNRNATTSSTNPYSSINPNVDTSAIGKTATEGANSLSPIISGLNNMANTSVNTSGAPNTSRTSAINRILDTANKGITSGDVNAISSLRPTNPYESQVSGALGSLADYAAGNSKVDRTLANYYLTKLDAAGASSAMAQGQRIASNPYLTAGAKQAAMAETQRATASERSKVAGELAAGAQERAFNATKDYANLTLEAANYEENKFKTDLAAASDVVKTKMESAIAAGNLESAEIQDNLNVWNTQINTQLADLTRQTNALVQSGQLTSDQAKMKMEGVMAEINQQQNNVTNSLNKARGILDFEKQQADIANNAIDADLKKSQIKQIESAIAAQNNENYKTWNSFATAAVLDYRSKNQGTALDNIDDALSNPQIQQALKSAWNAIPGNEGKPMPEDWAKAYYGGISTSAESAAATTKAKLDTLKKTWVDTGVMNESAFNSFTQQMQMVSDFGGSVRMSADGKSVYLVGADGKPLSDSSGATYSWNVTDGSRSTLGTETGTDIEKFDEWKKKNLLGSDTEGFTDSQVFDVYNKIVANGQTPNRFNMMEALRVDNSNKSENQLITDEVYEKYLEDYSLIDSLGVDSGGYLEPSIDKNKMMDIYNYELKNPSKAKFISNVDISKIQEDILTPSVLDEMKGYTDEQKYDLMRFETYPKIKQALEETKGKFISYLGKPVVNLGMSGNKYILFDITSGNKIYKNLTDVSLDTAKYILSK